MPEHAYCHDLTRADGLGPERIGGKAAGLTHLSRMGMTTPPGVAVTVDAFDDYLRRLDLADRLAALESQLQAGATDGPTLVSVRDAIASGPPPERLLNELEGWTRAWRAGGSGPRLIVRSSATVEDSAAHSYAGIFESIAVEDATALAPAIRSVWASGLSPRAVAYYRLSGLRRFPQIALVVQPFIEADHSGVMFTTFRGPAGDDALLIEYVEGDCDKLVTGAANPERLWLAPGSPAPECDLDPAVIDALAHAARRIEAACRGPQDVEWCVRGGDLFMLQARPITTAGGGTPGATSDAPTLASGLGASAGRSAGAAHLVFNIHDADRLERGRVLVTTMTNPDMVAAMQNSCAVVTDVGGMICHAAIVSRELRIPCVVGTEIATSVIAAGDEITVDGDAGAVYAGRLETAPARSGRPLTWGDLWAKWGSLPGRPMPAVSTVRALEHAPAGLTECLLRPYIDTVVDDDGQPRVPRRSRDGVVADARRVGDERGIHVRIADDPLGDTDSVPLGATFLGDARDDGDDRAPGGDGVFGREPATRDAPMPAAERRRVYHDLVPALRAAHGAPPPSGDETFTWLDLRPEIAITPVLRSLVLPGIECIPAAMRFADLPPLHVKWIRCRFHFRRDTFGATFARLMQSAWDAAFMDDMLARTRASYDRLQDTASAFPTTDSEFRAALAPRLRELFLRWWHAFVEFFSLSFFIQALGDDGMAPYAAGVVARHRERLAGAVDDGIVWPGVAELTAPLRPVLTAEYMADLLSLKRVLAGGDAAAIDGAVAAFGERWHWMRERDPYYPPYDEPAIIIEKARAARDAEPPDYAANADRFWLALSTHADLEIAGGDPARFVHAVSYGQALALDRENHHVVWLKASYPFRKLCMEWERRLREVAPLRERDIFFMEAPEILQAIERLPDPPPDELLSAVANRRAAFHREMRLEDPTGAGIEPIEEDDYY